MIIKEGKTNWNYILIVFILATVAGGGILGWQWWLKKQVAGEPELEIPKEMQERITVSSPADGEIWMIGETYQIRWTPNNPEGAVGIMLRDQRISGASASKSWQIENIQDTGTYSFAVSELLPGDKYQFYVSSKENYGYSKIFTITPSMADWNAYRNEDYNYEVKYPEDWMVEESSEMGTLFLGPILAEEMPETRNIMLIMKIWENPEQLSAEQWLTNKIREGTISPVGEFSDFTIDGIKGVKLFESENVPTKGFEGEESIAYLEKESAYISKENLIYGLSTAVGSPELFIDFNQILFTFRFLETEGPFLGSRILTEGMQGYDVDSLQERLELLSFYYNPFKYDLDITHIEGIKEDGGYFGENTKNAVINFQQVNNLQIAGKVDRETCKLLMKETGYYSKLIKYTVKEDDTLYSISKEYRGAGFAIIAKANSIDPSSIFPGQELYLLDAREVSGAGFQLIGKEDTITKLTKEWNVSEEIIKKANCITQDLELEIGESLYVPFKR